MTAGIRIALLRLIRPGYAMKTFKHLNRLWITLALLTLSLLCILVAICITNRIDYHNNDFFSFFLAGHLVVTGGDPYSSAQWVPAHQTFNVTWVSDQAFLYPLPLALLFAPFGLLSLYTAFVLWLALSEGMILASLWMLTSLKGIPGAKRLLIPLLAGVIFFRPTTLTLFQGQISAWLCFLLVAVVYLWEKGHWEWGSLLLPLLMLKPNIGAPLILLLGLWLLFQKRYRSLWFILLGGVALLLIGFIQDPRWVVEYWSIGNTKLAATFGGSPTVWGLGALIFHNRPVGTLLLGGGCALLVLFGFFWSALRPGVARSPLAVIGLAVTVTLLVTPYTWPYDQLLLLIPIVGLTLALHRLGFRLLISSTLILVFDLLAFLLLIPDSILGVEILNVIIPIIIFGLCLWETHTLPR